MVERFGLIESSTRKARQNHSIISKRRRELTEVGDEEIAGGREEDEEEDVEMEIGFPTDVQHVAHIGCDGSRTTILTLHDRDAAPGFLSLPALTLEEFVAGNSDTVEHVLLL
ncbi:hypothetical protein OPV22_029120 [Ensete ventricosum]|uniref:CRIB domain-containing protein n=1 Tax=Ensete ventricosum TaxID=4639 RepID=A0AAV8Q063_ENSVE|nr:hypothetical protein OPV22_029120 [Ensete ventricosum]